MSLTCYEIISGFLSWEGLQVLVVLVTIIAYNYRQTEKDRETERNRRRGITSPSIYTNPNLTSSDMTYL